MHACNILTIANAFGDKDVSGVDVVVKSYAKELIDKGHHVNVLARTRRFFDKTVKIAWKILRAKGDIYHCHYLLQDCWLALRSGKRPIVGHAHGSDLREVIRSRKWGWMVKRNLESCDRILVATPDLLYFTPLGTRAEWVVAPVDTEVSHPFACMQICGKVMAEPKEQ